MTSSPSGAGTAADVPGGSVPPLAELFPFPLDGFQLEAI
jgi:hypothetical protein